MKLNSAVLVSVPMP